jgi:hypothetical protein
MLNTRLAPFPLTARLAAPGPTMLKSWPMSISPERFVIVPVTAKVMQSSLFALVIAVRSEPGPLSASVVTTIDPAWLCKG